MSTRTTEGGDLGVGLVGYGASGRFFHAPVIGAVPGLTLTKVVERHTDESPKRYPWVEVVRDVEGLLGDDIDLVVVATPTDSHAELVERALAAGKHVVVEKPFAVSSARALALASVARERGLVLAVYQNRRWDGDFLTIRTLLGSGLLGRLVDYESRFDRFRNYLKPGAWREAAGEGSGVLFDIGVHLIDQALVLFGLPEAVTADVRAQREGAEADDSFELTLHYDALRVRLGAGMLARTPGPRFALHGTLGSFVKHGLDPQEDALRSRRTPAEPGWGEEPPERWGTLDTEVDGLHVRGRIETMAGCYQEFYRNVRDAIWGTKELAVKPEEAATAVRLIELARQSHAERRTVALR